MKLYTCFGEYGSVVQVIAETEEQARELMKGSYAYNDYHGSETPFVDVQEIKIGVVIDNVGDA